MAVTIRDVARKLDLSITTVSRALDGYDDVAEATRARVRRAAAELGYSPSHMARQMRRQRTDTLGYILPVARSHAEDVGRARPFSDPYFSEFIAGLGDEAARVGLDLLVSVAGADGDEEQVLYERWVRGRRVDGFVVNRLRINDWRTKFLAASGVPFVANGREVGKVDYPFIEVDSTGGFKALVEHLAAAGHTRIAYVGGLSTLRSQADRLAGYRAGLAAAGLRFRRDLVTAADLSRQGGREAGQRLLALARPPTAIVAFNDMTALGVMRAVRDRGLAVGRDIAVAGFDGIEDGAHTDPPLTTLIQPAYDIACRAVRMVAALIKNEPVEEMQIVLKPELVLRASTGDVA